MHCAMGTVAAGERTRVHASTRLTKHSVVPCWQMGGGSTKQKPVRRVTPAPHSRLKHCRTLAS